jgi:hypothetical protein
MCGQLSLFELIEVEASWMDFVKLGNDDKVVPF